MSKKKHHKKNQSLFGLGEISQPLSTKGDLKNTAIETTKDALVGALGGGVVGAAIGRASLVIGALITGISHYYKNNLGKVFGIGVMASGGFTKSDSSVSGTDSSSATTDFVEQAKERVMSFGEEFKQKLFLDKLNPKSNTQAAKQSAKKSSSKQVTAKSKTQAATDTESEDESDKQVGEIQHFVYPIQHKTAMSQVNLSDLDEIESGLHQSAAEYQGNNTGTEGLGDTELDPGETNY